MADNDLANADDALLGEQAADGDFDPFGPDTGGFTPRPGIHVMGKDGGLVQVDETTASDIPALSPKTLICMGDFSKFVLRDRWGDVVMEFEPDAVQRAPSGCWRVKLTRDIALALPQEFVGRDGPRWIEVEPIRPTCRHYARQLAQGGAFNLPQGEIVRMCTARRNPGGAFVDLSDKGVWACDLREPRDLASEAGRLDSFDARKVKQGAERIYVPLLGGSPSPAPTPPGEPP